MIPIVEIIRVEENYDHGTFGILKFNKELFCITLEPRDEENQQCISSIPVQQYICKRYNSPKFHETFQVMDVPGRSKILFHAGNIDEHTQGCILLGNSVDKFKTGERCVLNSGLTFKRFMNAMDGTDKFHLTIQEHF